MTNEPTILINEQPEEKKSLTTTNRNLPQSRIAGIDVNALLSKAIDHNTPVETMEKLLAMARQLKSDYAKEQFNIALSEFQAECPEIVKTVHVRYQSKSGAWVDYHYAPIKDIIKQVKPLMRKYGFSHTYKTKQTKDSVTVICLILHVDGHSEPSEITMPIDSGSKMNPAQKIGTAFTYGWRYTFCGGMGITTGDEDKDANDLYPDNNGEKPRQEKPTYPPSPKGNTMPKMTVIQYKDDILTMLKNDTNGVFSDEQKNDIRKRIAKDKPYRGGWAALYEKVKLEIEKVTVPF